MVPQPSRYRTTDGTDAERWQPPLILIAGFSLLAAAPAAAAPAWARYRVVSSPEHGDLPARSATVAALPDGGAWHLHLDLDGRRSLRAWFASDRVPMRAGADGPGVVRRYVLEEDGEAPLEYVNAETGLALLPPFQFVEQLLPRPAPRAPVEDGWAANGTLLGHVLSLEAAGAGNPPDAAWPTRAERLALDPGLLICPGCWPIRETDPGRVKPPADYQYRPLNEAEYDELIAAGANLFSITDREEPWVRRRAFYRKSVVAPNAAPYPAILYRSTFVGTCMCIDEPAIRLQIDPRSLDAMRRPQDMARLIETRTRTYFHDAGHGRAVAAALRGRGVNLGFYEPFERDLIVWETEYPAAYYELAAGPPGIIHEGRYDVRTYEQELARLFGPGLRLSPDEMLELHVAFLRGAARAFDADWGISIYGQCDPDLAVPALRLAYDRGARYLWFWTADHDHHVPHPEKIAWIRRLVAHARAHPRRPRADLRRAADLAVAFPDGYTLHTGALWGNPRVQPGDRNPAGVPHREVIAAAMWEALLLAKQGVPFDFIIDQKDTSRHGYGKVIVVDEDGSVRK